MNINDQTLLTKKTNHTEGPWEIRGFHGAVEKIGPVNDKDVTVAMMPHWDTHIPEKLANARLIAQAPAILAELEQCGGILLALQIKLAGVVSQKVVDDIQARLDAIDAVLNKVRG